MTTPTISINIAVGLTGATPTPPAVIQNNLLVYLQAVNPGYTILPAGMIEDLLDTSIAGIQLIDQCAVDLINSLTPNDANPWLLYLLGQMYGVPIGQDTNTSVYVVFSGPAGYFIPAGFTVGDGTYQYVVQDGGAIATGGQSQPLFCLATTTGAWAVLPNTVTTIITTIPAPYTTEITVTNPNTGTPSPGPETVEDYRFRTIQAGIATAQGMPAFLKTQLENVPGVQSNLVSVKQVNGGGWEVICGGGDPYQVAGAIFKGAGDISSLVGSSIGITGITNANPGVVTTNLNHGLITGQANVHIAGVVGMAGVNGGPYTVTVISPTTFSFGVDTTGSGTYVSGGVVTPNARTITVNIIDPPDTYTIPFVNPPAQAVTVQLTWNTDSPNIVSSIAVAQLGAPAIAAYVAGIPVGQPINIFEMQDVFTLAIASVLDSNFLSRMVWTVSIDAVDTPPLSGTGLIYGDPESYFTCAAPNVTVAQG